MLAFIIYLLGLVDNLVLVSATVGALSLVAGVVLKVISLDDEVELPPEAKKLIRPVFFAGIALVSIAVFTPNSKTLAAMYLVPKIVANERLQNIGDNGLKVLEGLTKKWADNVAGVEEKK